MQQFNLDNILRSNIKNLVPYSSARSEFEGDTQIFLDANENSLGSALKLKNGLDFNRYPDPLQKKLKESINNIAKIPVEKMFIGNGSDEAIDLLIRAFCEPAKDAILIFPPTYGMYEVSAAINDVAITKVLLNKEFQINIDKATKAINKHTKIIFVCSPNNPTGNLIDTTAIETLLQNFSGVVVVDEAYIDFANGFSWKHKLDKYPNLVVMQTLSKAWGLAGLRVGIAFASTEIINVLNKIKPPYNINAATQLFAEIGLSKEIIAYKKIKTLIKEKDKLILEFSLFSFIEKIYHSDANFILIKVNDANNLYSYLLLKNIVVRNRSNQPLCENSLRITVGTPDENEKLIAALKDYK